MKTQFASFFILAFGLALLGPPVTLASDGSEQISTYAKIVHANYQDAYNDALVLKQSVTAFLAAPSQKTLAAAKAAWLKARNSYGQTEVYRFYEGPIDYVDAKSGKEGPEGRLNAWPLNEAYIDYVKGNPKAGIVQDEAIEISKETLLKKNQEDDEANVSTGYHAIEFLLWGQDLSLNTAGNRPYSDYLKGDPIKERRGKYLALVTEILVDDLKFLVDSWKPGKANFARQFTQDDADKSLEKIMSALSTLSGFELASERMATALDSGDQEDEHSCFSDNTHNDFIYNAKGIKNVYLGSYRAIRGKSIHQLIQARDPKLADTILNQLNTTEKLLGALPRPIDREVLSTKKGSAGRVQMEAAVESLQTQADLLKKGGETLGLKVEVITG